MWVGSMGLVRRGEGGLRLGGFGHGAGELVAAHEPEDRREGDQRDRAEHSERALKAAGEGRGHRDATVKQRARVADGNA
jgi:hypothetical protein